MKTTTKFLFILLAGVSLFASCTDIDLPNSAPTTATTVESLSGDFSRTLIVDEFLYGVDQTSIVTYDISNPDAIDLVGRTDVGLALETIYHHDGNLFIGSRRGMYIYSISRNGTPVARGDFDYSNLPNVVQPCDPVVAEGNTAYASLYTGDERGVCNRATDLQTIVVMDISNLDNPTLVQMHDVQTPRGIAIDNDILFVCNNENGLTVYDVSDRTNFVEVDRINNVNAWDAIATNNKLTVVGATEVIQYDYSNPSELVELSRLVYPNL
jgi:hypothetical protein